MSRDLDGVFDYITTSNIVNPNDGAFSASIWARSDSFGHLNANGDTANIVQQENGTGTGRGWIYINRVNSTTYRVRSAIGGSAIEGTTNLNGDTGWHHFAVTASSGGSGTVRLYLDGVEQVNATRNPESSTGGMRIGAHKSPSGVSEEWNGKVAEFGVWDVELTVNEILGLARGRDLFRVRNASNKIYLKLWGIDSPEPDLSGNGLNGTLVSAPPRGDHAPVELFSGILATTGNPFLEFPVAGGGGELLQISHIQNFNKQLIGGMRA